MTQSTQPTPTPAAAQLLGNQTLLQGPQGAAVVSLLTICIPDFGPKELRARKSGTPSL